MRVWLAAVISLAALAGCRTNPPPAPASPTALQPGDLLFQDLDCGPLCEAIESVTQGYQGAHLSHVGMVASTDGAEPMVIEAIGDSVRLTPVSRFLARSSDAQGRPKVLVGRLQGEPAQLIAKALDRARSQLGKPYDDRFLMGNDAFYCSELIYDAFQFANAGEPVFELAPMTYRNPSTGQTFAPWSRYFAELNMPVPEGLPGLNPGGMSRASFVRIVYAFGAPEGWAQASPSHR